MQGTSHRRGIGKTLTDYVDKRSKTWDTGTNDGHARFQYGPYPCVNIVPYILVSCENETKQRANLHVTSMTPCCRPSLERTTTQTMLTITTLTLMLATNQKASRLQTYKPAKVKRAVRTICCLRVVRRRHKSGIGCQGVNTYLPSGRIATGTYEHKNQKVEGDVD